MAIPAGFTLGEVVGMGELGIRALTRGAIAPRRTRAISSSPGNSPIERTNPIRIAGARRAATPGESATNPAPTRARKSAGIGRVTLIKTLRTLPTPKGPQEASPTGFEPRDLCFRSLEV